jgi:hypothetical protein
MASASQSGSYSENEYEFKDEVWDGQSNALQRLYKSLGGLFDTTNEQVQGLIPDAIKGQQEVTEQSKPYWQKQMEGGAYQGLGIGKQLMNSLYKSENTPSNLQQINSMIMGGEGNNYADVMRDRYIKDANRTQENMLANLDARAAGAGMLGSSRHGVAQGIGMRGINDQLQRQMAKTGYESFDKDLDRKLGIAQQADQNSFGRQQLMSGMLGQEQNAQMGGLGYGQQMQGLNMGQFAPTMMPWEAVGKYTSGIGAPTVLSSGSGSGMSMSGSVSGSYGGSGGGGGGG